MQRNVSSVGVQADREERLKHVSYMWKLHDCFIGLLKNTSEGFEI